MSFCDAINLALTMMAASVPLPHVLAQL